VILLQSIEKGSVISSWGLVSLGGDKHSIALSTFSQADAIPNGSSGTVLYLNFSVVGDSGDSTLMSPTSIDFANTSNEHGTATASTGTFSLPQYPLANYTITEGNTTEFIEFMNHNPSPTGGNWIKLSGGEEVSSPSIMFKYNTTSSSKSYTVGTKTITIQCSQTSDEIGYPFNTHNLYYFEQGFNATFYGASSFAQENVSFWLTPGSLGDIKDIDSGLRNGNTQPLRQLLNSAGRQNAVLNATGDAIASFYYLGEGSHLLFVTNKLIDPLADDTIRIYSITPVEVLDYPSEVDVQSAVFVGTPELPVTITIDTHRVYEQAQQTSQYRYGAMLIKDSAYRYEVELTSDTTAANTHLDVNGERIVEGMNLIDTTKANAQNVIRDTTGAGNGSVAINELTSATSETVYLDIGALDVGTYKLITAVYENGKQVAALKVTNFAIVPLGPAPNVHVRVESNTTTLFNDTITVPANCTVVDTVNASHYIDHPTALGALVEVANQSGFTYNITDYGTWGLLINDINGDTWVSYRVGPGSPSVGAEMYNLTGGEYVLFATGEYYPFYPLYLTAQANVNSPFNVNVRYYNDTAEDWAPLEGATVFVDGTPAGTTTNAYGNLELNLPTGTYQLRAEKVGYVRSEFVNVSVVDLTSPVITITSPADGSTTRFTTVGLSVSVNEYSSIWYSVDGGANSTAVNGTSIGATITGLSESVHSIVVYARDQSGNLGSRLTSFTVDHTPPTLTIISPIEGATYGITSVLLNASIGESGTLWYRLDSRPNSTPVSDPLTVTMRSLSEGSHTVVVYGRDTAGNVNSSSVSFNVSVPKPDLTSTINVQVVAGGSSTVSTGTTLKLSALITNSGVGNAPSTHAAFYIDGVKLADKPVRALAGGGDSVTVDVTWVPINPAQYDIVSMADSLRKVVETNESDNNDTWTLTARGTPDLVATGLQSDYRIPVNTPTNLTLTVNCKGASASNIPVELFERMWVSGQGYRYLPVVGASAVISSMAAGSTQKVNLTYTPTSYGYKYLMAAIDPNNTITETTKANNNITRTMYVSYSDLTAYIYGMSSTALGFKTNIRVSVSNSGALPAGVETLTVWAYDGTTNTTLYTTSVPSLGGWSSRTYTVPWTPTAAGTYTITALVSASNTSDYSHYNNKYVRTISVRDYNITAWYTNYPGYGVYEGRYFYVSAYLNTTGAGYVNASLSFEPGSGITVYDPNKRTYTYGSKYDYVYWQCKGNVAGLYTATMTFEANGKNTTISTNDTQWNMSPYGYRYHPYSPYGVKIIVQTVEVKDENSTVLAGTESDNLTYQVFDVNSTNQNGKVDIIAGGTQRMLTGLDYLKGYPNGCVEQVASPLVAALRIAEYYAAYGYLDATNNSSLNCTVGKAVYDLQYGHLKPYTNGAWSMWGRRHSTSDDSQYFTTYSVYALASVRNSSSVTYSVIDNQRSDCSYRSYFPMAVNDTLIDKGAVWLTTQQQQTNATQGWWVGRGSDYIRSPNTLSAWVVRSLIVAKPFSEAGHQNDIQASINKGIAFLLDHQNPDGGWADEKGGSGAYGVSNAYTTGLVLHVLATSNNTSAEVTTAKNSATNWLATHQESDGSFAPTSRDMAGHSYSRIGVYTEAAAYPLLGLNATGIEATNDTIEKGRNYLFGVYQSDGSWGYTKSSAVVIDALTRTTIPGGIINLNITVGIDGTTVTIVHLNNANTKAVIPLWGERTNTSSPLGAGNHTVTLVQVGDGTSLVGVTHSQTVPKREAIANVPSEYIDPLAEEFSLNVTYHDASTANASLAPELSSAVVNEKVRVNATVTNINTTDGLIVLIMDVPIPTNTTFAQDSLDPLSYSGDLVNGTLEWFSNTSYTDACNWSYNTNSRVLSIYPEQLNASEKKSYYFNVSYNASGVQSLTNVNVKPMYNPTLIAENNSSIYVKGYDSVSFELLNETEGAVSATLKWNGSGVQMGTGIIYNNTTLEGDYRLNFTSTGYLPVLSTISVLPDQLANYTATFLTALSEPKVVFFEKNSSTATLPVEFTNGSGWMYYNTTLVTAGGVVTVAMEKPAGNDVVFVNAMLNDTPTTPTWYSDTTIALYIKGSVEGNSSVNITFRDIGTPVVSINSPTNNTYDVNTIDLNATSNESSDMWYTANGEVGSVVNNSTEYSTTLTLGDGDYTIVVHSKDMGGNDGTDEVNITVDTAAPLITVSSPVANATYPSSSVQLDVSTDETADIWFNYNGTNSTAVSGTTLTATMTGLSEGANTVYVYAKDAINHTNISSVTFNVDTQGPSVDISLPVEGGTYGGNIWIVANANDTVSHMWYNLDGGVNSTPVANNSLTTIRSGLSEGAHALNVFANDSVGNVGTAVANFTVDTTAPTVNILSPSEGATTNASVVLQANSSENADFYYSVDNGTDTSFGNSTTSTQTTLNLAAGNHSIVVKAYDIADNVGNDTVNITVETAGVTTHVLHLGTGWNMISLPLVPTNSSPSVIFADIPTLSLYPVITWNQSAVSYVEVDTIEAKKGYFVFTPTAKDITVNGTAISNTTLQLGIGWNMVGTVGMSNLTLSDIPNQLPTAKPRIWSQPAISYVEIDALEAGKSAFVFVYTSTEVTI